MLWQFPSLRNAAAWVLETARGVNPSVITSAAPLLVSQTYLDVATPFEGVVLGNPTVGLASMARKQAGL